MTSRYGRPLEFGLSLVPNAPPGEEPLAQIERFAHEVVPALR